MTTRSSHIRHGLGAVRPYLYGSSDLPDLLKHAFAAVELERIASGGGFHVEMKIGDSVVVIETGDHAPDDARTTRASVYVYVEDVDAAYARALERGATSLSAPEDKPYHERGAGVRDALGNTWWIATYVAPR